MSKKKRAVRTDLSDAEWALLKSKAALMGQTIEAIATSALRAVLKGAKP